MLTVALLICVAVAVAGRAAYLVAGEAGQRKAVPVPVRVRRP